jgi:hypothetical protein
MRGIIYERHISMANYWIKIFDPKGEVLFQMEMHKTLVNVSAKTDGEKVDFILAEVPKLGPGGARPRN